MSWRDPEVLDGLKHWVDAGVLRGVDWQFARWVARTTADKTGPVLLAAALASWRLSHGDVCVNLEEYAGKSPFEGPPHLRENCQAPPLNQWIRALSESPAVSVASNCPSAGNDPCEVSTPLVLDAGKIYLTRYWYYERELASRLIRMATSSFEIPEGRLRHILDGLFPAGDASDQVDWQKVAAATAVMKRLTIISGGPGTGKTHTVAALLAALHQIQPHEPLRAALAAPTGKAAARITEAVRKAVEILRLDPAIRNALPKETTTLHRLIGMRQDRAVPRFGPENPLPVDVLVVDEASMVDLPMMTFTVMALPDHARLILLGDKDQLASVEAGSVFADLCGRGRTPAVSRKWLKTLCDATGMDLGVQLRSKDQCASPLDECTVFLRRSYRFKKESPIGVLAASIRDGNRSDLENLLSRSAPGHSSPASRTTPFPDGEVQVNSIPSAQLPAALTEITQQVLDDIFTSKSPLQALQVLDRFRILCALREGPFGVVRANRLVERALIARGRIFEDKHYYKGRPVLVTENDYDLQLFNGDVGILWPDDNENLWAWFRQADGSLKKVRPLRLPPHETAYAMTIHKAQGSEFDRVLIILPDEDSPILTRELLYTAVTRARKSVILWADSKIVRLTASRHTQRRSGLYERLFTQKIS